MKKDERKDFLSKFFMAFWIFSSVLLITFFCYALIIGSDWKYDRISLAAVLEKRGGTVSSDGVTIPLDNATRKFYTNMTSFNYYARPISKKNMDINEDSIVIRIDDCTIVINSALNGNALNFTWFDGTNNKSYTVNTQMKFNTCKIQFTSSSIAYENLKSSKN